MLVTHILVVMGSYFKLDCALFEPMPPSHSQEDSYCHSALSSQSYTYMLNHEVLVSILFTLIHVGRLNIHMYYIAMVDW